VRDITSSTSQPELEKMLNDGIRCMQGLKSILADERVALERRDAIALESTAKSKEELANKLTGFDRYAADIKNLAGATGSLSDRWREFQSIAKDCDLLNRTNGTIIRSRQQQVLAGLSLLRGNGSNDSTYTSTGSAPADVGRRTITEA
jgi:flagellar biosynthesis/type III secretory pathway chaperone